MKNVLYLLIAVTAMWVVPQSATAQYLGTPDEMVATGTAYKIFAQPGEPTITVQLMGDLSGGGIYVVGDQTTLTELISLAGGTPQGEGTARVSGTWTFRVHRDVGGVRETIYEAGRDDFVRTPGAHPRLRDGDVVTVDLAARERFDLLRTVSVLSGLSSLALLVIRIFDGF